MIKEPRLRFTDEERADPALEKPIRGDRAAAAKADKAQAKIPKKQVRQKAVDLETGKVTTKLVLEDKPRPPSKLSHAVRDAPGDAALGKLHKEIRETEQDNVGVESAHKSEEAVETGARLVRGRLPQPHVETLPQGGPGRTKAGKANINALYQKVPAGKSPAYQQPFSPAGSRNSRSKRNTLPPNAPVKLSETPPVRKKTGKAAKTVKEKAQQAGICCATKGQGIDGARLVSSAGCSTPCPPAP